MPRYTQPRERRDPKSERLAQLAALAQIYQGMQGPQMRQQEGQQQNALAILGLLMNQQNQAAQLKQNQSAQDMRSGEFWGGTYPLQQQELAQKEAAQKSAQEIALGQLANQGAGIAYSAANANAAQQQAARELEATRAHQEAMQTIGLGQLANQGAQTAYEAAKSHQVLEAQKEVQSRAGSQDTFKTLMATPGADVTSALKFLPQDQQPIVQQIHQEQVARETAKHQSAIQALTDPKMRDMYLGSINVHPDVRANLLQAAVPQAVAPQVAPQTQAPQAQSQPTPVDVAFPGSSNPPGQGGIDWGRLGYLLKTIGGIVPDPATASPEQKAIWEQKRLRDSQLQRR